MVPDSTGQRLSRRGFMSYSAAASSLSLVGATTGSAEAKESEAWDAVDGVSHPSGWTPEGEESLEQVTSEVAPQVLDGEGSALWVDSNGQPNPGIGHDSIFTQGLLRDHPFVELDVFHHSPINRSGIELVLGVGRNLEDGLVASRSVTVEEPTVTTVSIDVEDLSPSTRRTLSGLKVQWKPLEEPESYEGHLYLSNLRRTSRPTAADRQRLTRTEHRLRRKHGSIEGRTVHSSNGDREIGTFTFADGAKVRYAVEQIDTDRSRYELDGEQFRLGGGWT